ncbi:MAG: NAD(+) synthase [Ignavibacteriaceae bacterium]
MKFHYDSINIDAPAEAENIIYNIKNLISTKLKKRGAVIGISGGLDSSVVLALCAKALGPKRVLGVMLPEKDSSGDSMLLAENAARNYNVPVVVEDLTNALRGFRCYFRRDEAVMKIFPEYNSSYKMKISLSSEKIERLNCFHITAISPEGIIKTERLPAEEYLQIMAASNLKQRSRMSLLYYHAERRNYAVIGTANKNEHELGFFVKYGDGGSDIKPIAHLFKTQVYQLASYLQVPENIILRTPTTDTYTAEQTQQEFFFQVPFKILDRVWYAMENGCSPSDTAEALGISEQEVISIENNIKQKIKGTEYLRMDPLSVVQKKEETIL